MDKLSHPEDSDVRAYMNGIDDADNYDACDPNGWGYEGEQAASYREGYGDGMDVNIKYDSGICPEPLRGY